jgi:hypothetical protein
MNTFRFPKGPALAEHVENIAAASGALQSAILSPASTSLVPVPPSLADLSAAALASHRAYESNLVAAADKAIETGLRLIELKARVRKEFGHGYWEEYLAETFPFTIRTAQNYMRLAKHKPLTGQENERDFRFLKQHKAAKIIGAVQAKK